MGVRGGVEWARHLHIPVGRTEIGYVFAKHIMTFQGLKTISFSTEKERGRLVRQVSSQLSILPHSPYHSWGGTWSCEYLLNTPQVVSVWLCVVFHFEKPWKIKYCWNRFQGVARTAVNLPCLKYFPHFMLKCEKQ